MSDKKSLVQWYTEKFLEIGYTLRQDGDSFSLSDDEGHCLKGMSYLDLCQMGKRQFGH
jgi:hypothetical protein